MSSADNAGRPVRRLLAIAAATAVAVTGALAAAGPSHADQRYLARGPATIQVIGHGFGHGRGMSQWGAYGAAVSGLTYSQILAFYYPGTTLSSLSDPAMRVLISSDTDGTVEVLPSPGLALCRAGLATSTVLPTATPTAYRLLMYGGTLRLEYYYSGAWHLSAMTVGGTSATFTRSTSCSSLGALGMTLVLPGGTQRGVRGGLRAQVDAGHVRTVGIMGMTSYLASVVPSEMPAGWSTAALEAQAVAARSYAERYRLDSGGAGHLWDICDTTACQVFNGTGSEWPTSTAAVSATAGRTLTYGGEPAFTEFSASNGGWTTAGSSSTPYLVAKADPYDGKVASYGSSPNPHTWTASVSVSRLRSAYPTIGTIEWIQVSARDGHGDYGGRTETVVIQGSSGHATLTGSQFASLAGLKSIWWTVRHASPAYDLNDNGTADVIARSATTGDVTVYSGTGTGGLVAGASHSGWAGNTDVLMVGDLTGDGRTDVLARRTGTGDVYLYPGDGAGWVGGGTLVMSGLTRPGKLFAAGDISGDGHDDLMGIDKTTGELLLYRGNGAGGISSTPLVAGTGWGGFTAVFGAGDVNGDGYQDLIARTAAGALMLYAGNGAGRFQAGVSLGLGYAGYTHLMGAGDLTGDGLPDLLATTSAGSLVLFPGTGSGYGHGHTIAATGWAGYNVVS